MRRVCLVAAGLLATAPALAQSGCDQFAWSLKREQAAFSSPDLPVLAAGGATLPDLAGVTLTLRPSGEVDFPISPERAPRPETFGGYVRLPAVPAAGVYQASLSDDAWIDVSQNGRTMLKAVSHSGRKDCPGMRKSVRFHLATGSALIAISNSPVRSIKLSLVPSEP